MMRWDEIDDKTARRGDGKMAKFPISPGFGLPWLVCLLDYFLTGNMRVSPPRNDKMAKNGSYIQRLLS